MLENLNKYEIVLASNSPRRKELLQRMGVNFKVRTLFGIDESYPDSLRGEDIVCYISRNKAKAYQSSMAPNELLITADTIVYVDGEVMGKPKNAEQAKEMLHKLSGKTHQVITGVTIVTAKRTENFGVTSQVKFTNITDEEINFYVDNYLPFDKAGAYGIQGRFAAYVDGIEGDYNNVVGLPVSAVWQELKELL